MNDKEIVKTSKFLSQVLRHKPEAIGIELDENGWTGVEQLLKKLNDNNCEINLDDLKSIVENNDKKRFSFSPDFTKIRASQGHSVDIDLNYKPLEPPEFLYHGTATKNINSILEKGILKKARQHVHFSIDKETAIKVGSRHGKPAVLKINTGEMYRDGLTFYLSDNKVWLADNVPAQYIVLDEN